jgi:hypothetical protein
MDLSPGFSYSPTTPPVPTTAPYPPDGPPPTPPPVVPPTELGDLAGLIGTWKGNGFNAIWRPFQPSATITPVPFPSAPVTGSDRFLELNLTTETLEFTVIPGTIPNRGLLQGDLIMAGVRYLQQISDANVIDPTTNQNAGLHVEPGLWLSVPATTDPPVPASVARLASIPHGTTGVGLTNVTQSMLDNPNSVLTQDAVTDITTTTTITVSSVQTPIIGGGTADTAFLQGGPDGPNANSARVDATFWLQTSQGASQPNVLQYSQLVFLNFNGLSWPHVTVGSLKRVQDQPT